MLTWLFFILELEPLLEERDRTSTPAPYSQHDYISPVRKDVSIQTDITMSDIDNLVEEANRHVPEPIEVPAGQEIINCVVDTDERTNFYTGIISVAMLYGMPCIL